jgi:hypothetical protein
VSSQVNKPPTAETLDSVAQASAAQIQQLVSVERVTLNVSQNVIVTTEDKLKLCLQNHKHYIDRKNDWIAPFSVLLSLLLVFVSADFRDFVLPKDTWRAIFVVASVLTVFWLCMTLRSAFSKRTMETLIAEIKADKS